MTSYEMIPNSLYISGRLNQDDWEYVKKNIDVVVNLRTTPDIPPFHTQNITYYWFPLTIIIAPSLEWTIKFSDFINHLIDSGYRILIHDHLGIQRLGYAIVAVYMKRFNLTLNQALFEVRKVKNNLEPTPNYMKVLTQYEQFLFS